MVGAGTFPLSSISFSTVYLFLNPSGARSQLLAGRTLLCTSSKYVVDSWGSRELVVRCGAIDCMLWGIVSGCRLDLLVSSEMVDGGRRYLSSSKSQL